MADDRTRTISGTFATRDEADRAIEHLVQEYDIDRSDIFVQPHGDANTAGVAASRSDAISDQVEGSALDPALRGRIHISADVARGDVARAEKALRGAGAEAVTVR